MQSDFSSKQENLSALSLIGLYNNYTTDRLREFFEKSTKALDVSDQSTQKMVMRAFFTL